MSKEILILGASSELGLKTIENLYNKYDKIVAHYNKNDAGLTVLQKNMGDKLVLESCDFSDKEETEAFAIHIKEAYPHLCHVLHLPAAKIFTDRFPKKPWEGVERDINIGLRSVYIVLQKIMGGLAKSGQGKVVFALSSVVKNTPKYLIDYNCAKCAMLGFMQSLAEEYASKKVAVNAVSPSMMETKLVSDLPRLMVEQNAQSNPMGRNATAADVVPAIAYLLSDDSGFVTGQNLVVSGGSVF